MFKNVLVLSASAGAGHLRAAQAIERAFTELGATREFRHIDALEYTNKLFRNLYSKSRARRAQRRITTTRQDITPQKRLTGPLADSNVIPEADAVRKWRFV
ncbi:MAG: hypothetical protein GXY44_10920 [Phycisphaerales bacterium]|nr:hypothetical protein [Phycisphaerales bacterium]